MSIHSPKFTYFRVWPTAHRGTKSTRLCQPTTPPDGLSLALAHYQPAMECRRTRARMSSPRDFTCHKVEVAYALPMLARSVIGRGSLLSCRSRSININGTRPWYTLTNVDQQGQFERTSSSANDSAQFCDEPSSATLAPAGLRLPQARISDFSQQIGMPALRNDPAPV